MNNFWHTPIFIPDPFRAYPIIVIYEAGDEIEQMMSNEYRTRVGDRYVNRWCYVNDLLNCEKALEIAVDALKTVRRYTAINQFTPKSREAHFVAKKAIKEITALTKGGDNE